MKTPRRYKVTPLHERISNAPHDVLLFLHEWLQLLEWDEWLDSAANTIGVGANVLYLLLKFYHGDVFTDDEFIEYSSVKPIATPRLHPTDSTDSTWELWLSLSTIARALEFVIILISLLNALALATRRKSFTLLQHPTEPSESRPHDSSWNLTAKTRNAMLVPLDVAPTDARLIESDSDDDDTPFTKTPTPLKRRGVGSPFSTPGDSVKRTLREAMAGWSPWSAASNKKDKRNRGPKESKMEYHWVLNVWDPKNWSITLFCWLSPPAILTLYSLNHNNWAHLLPIAILIHAMTHAMMALFLAKLADQEILNSQLQKEYNKFVYSLPPFRNTRTVGVQTQIILKKNT